MVNLNLNYSFTVEHKLENSEYNTLKVCTLFCDKLLKFDMLYISSYFLNSAPVVVHRETSKEWKIKLLT